MARDTSLGFKFEYRECGGNPTILDLPYKDAETLTKGDLLNLESGEVDLGATNDSAFLGIALETGLGVASTTMMRVITDDDAVYSVYDQNARLAGATLDIAGTTGAMTVAASSNVDLLVVATSGADERTLVKIAHGEHWKN
jgi:hypothetical protein